MIGAYLIDGSRGRIRCVGLVGSVGLVVFNSTRPCQRQIEDDFLRFNEDTPVVDGWVVEEQEHKDINNKKLLEVGKVEQSLKTEA